MATEAVYFKEHEGILPNSAPAAPWWTTYGTQPFLGDSLRQSNGSFGDRSISGEQFTASKQAAPAEQGADKGNLTQFTISPGDKDSEEGQVSQAAAFTTPPADYCTRFELGFVQPMVCAKYPFVDPCYGVFSHGPQLTGRIMLPLDLGADDGPIFVNPKQYHGIIRRRKSRAKAELLNRATRARKAYMHESRHLHAMRRPRGSGGRFLNTKSMDNTKGYDSNKDHVATQPTDSQSSEVLQSDSGSGGSSSKETNGGRPSNLSAAEVSSMYAREDLDRFSMTHHHRPSIHFLPHEMDRRHHTMVIPSKWVAAAAPDSSCCNLKV